MALTCEHTQTYPLNLTNFHSGRRERTFQKNDVELKRRLKLMECYRDTEMGDNVVLEVPVISYSALLFTQYIENMKLL